MQARKYETILHRAPKIYFLQKHILLLLFGLYFDRKSVCFIRYMRIAMRKKNETVLVGVI